MAAWSIPDDRVPRLSDCLRGGLGIYRIQCSRCERRGAYDVRRALAEFGDMDLLAFRSAKGIGVDCPNRTAMIDAQRCSISCPDLMLLYAPKCYQCADGRGGGRPHGIAEALRRTLAHREARKQGR